MFLKLPDGASRVVVECSQVKFERINESAFHVLVTRENGTTETYPVSSKCYVLNERGDTIDVFDPTRQTHQAGG